MSGLAAFTVALAVLFAPVGAEAATKPVTACVNKKGAARFLPKPGKCKRGERRMNLLTAPGDAGPQGPAGANGTNGANGVNGTNGTDGAAGAQGAKGEAGGIGPTGPAGSPDTPAQVLAKLADVDGAGSGLDADLLGGIPSTGYQRRGATTSCPAGQFASGWAVDGNVVCTAPASAILNQSAVAQNATMRITGDISTTGLLRTGNNTGTTEGTPLGGVVVRPVQTFSATAGNVVARGAGFVIQRDGTQDGLQFKVDDLIGTFASLQCTGVRQDGTFVGVSFGTSAATTVQIVPDGSNWMSLHCLGGMPYSTYQGSTLMLDLHRYSPSYDDYGGFLISTVNQ
jgi:hypothetical protein